MEPDCIHLVIDHIGCHFFLGEPSFVGETELEFVAVASGFLRTDDG